MCELHIAPAPPGWPYVSEPLSELLDAKHLATELGVTRAAAEAIMRRLPVVRSKDCARSTCAVTMFVATSTRGRSPRTRSRL